MTAKEHFLQKMEELIKTSESELIALKEAYLQNKKLPDSFFQHLQSPPEISEIMVHAPKSENPPLLTGGEAVSVITNSDYGRNRKLVLQILKDEGKALLKGNIVSKFEELTGETNTTGIITNALASLSTEGTVIGFKNEEVKVRGLYWGLKSWFDEKGKILENHKPAPYNKYAYLL